MKHILRRFLPLALALALLCALAPCALAEVIGLKLPDYLDLGLGRSETLTAALIRSEDDAGDGGEESEVSWAVTKGRDIIRLDGKTGEDGAVTGASVTVTALKVGNATISATHGRYTEICEVTVSIVPTESVTLSSPSLTFQVGQTRSLTATLVPSDASDQTVLWSVTGSVASLDKKETVSGESVTVTGLRTGQTTITASSTDGKTASCTVTVSAVEIPASLTDGTLKFSSLIGTVRTYCQNITGSPLSHLTNIAVNTAAGTLYEGYISEADHGEGVSTSQSYYDSSSGPHQIERIIFVPRPGFNGTATINFTAYAESGGLFTGSAIVDIPGTTLIYTSENGEPVSFRSTDFSNYSHTAGNSFVNYVRFELPPASSGKLYFNYIDSDINEGPISASTLFHPNTYPSINKVWFVPSPGFSGLVTINFTYADSSGATYPGFLQVNVVNAASSGAGDISYSVGPGESVRFDAADFNDLSYDEIGYALNYVRFTTLPASTSGTLYCGGSEVTANQSLYRSGTSGRLLSDVYFTARRNYTGTVPIPFTATASNGKTFSGTVTITVSASTDKPDSDTNFATGSIIAYRSTGEAVAFRSQDFFYDAAQYLSQPLSTVRFYTPEVSQGRLCLNYVSPTSYAILDTSRAYPYTTASAISFQPRSGFSGAAYIRFIAADQTGKSYTGTLAVNVDPPVSSAYFDDMRAHSWAIPSVDFLARSNILIGTEHRAFSPAGLTKRGDFILMLQRCFNFSSVPDNVFDDVPAGSYYASAIAGANAIGIATGDGNGKFRPDAPLTRQEAAEFLYRCMRRSGSLQDGTAADLAAFSDSGQVAGYAVTAMATLVRLGVLAGDGGGRLNPAQSLTRAEMAVMFHRALT